MLSSHYFNPQDGAKQIMTKSFLKSRQQARQDGSQFFHDNKIRSCSFIKQDKKQGTLKAVAFYDKRNNTMYPTKSDFTQSWNSTVHSRPQSVNAGMGPNKPLSSYEPNKQRNLLNVPDFIPPYPNSSKINIGHRNKKDVKHYITNYGNSHSFVHQSRRLHSNNPAIQAFRHKWIKSRLDK